MKERWDRQVPVVELEVADLSRLLRPVCQDESVSRAERIEVGLTNTNYLAELAPSGRRVRIRIHTRGGLGAAVEAAVLQSFRHALPVPELLVAEPNNPITGHPYAVLEWVEGETLDRAVLGAPPADVEGLGRAVGATLAAIHAIEFPEYGFFDPSLSVAETLDVSGNGLCGILQELLGEEPARARLGAALVDDVLAFAAERRYMLDAFRGPPTLTHSDFGGSNILVRRAAGGGWEVAAVIDWEFALSATPFIDFGNLLRPPLGEIENFEEAVVDGYVGAGGLLPRDWKMMSLLSDLVAWADFLARPAPGQKLIEDARHRIARTLALSRRG